MKVSIPEAQRGARLDSPRPPQLCLARRRAASASSVLCGARKSANGSVTHRAQSCVPYGCTDRSSDARPVTDTHEAAQKRRRAYESPCFIFSRKERRFGAAKLLEYISFFAVLTYICFFHIGYYSQLQLHLFFFALLFFCLM